MAHFLDRAVAIAVVPQGIPLRRRSGLTLPIDGRTGLFAGGGSACDTCVCQFERPFDSRDQRGIE